MSLEEAIAAIKEVFKEISYGSQGYITKADFMAHSFAQYLFYGIQTKILEATFDQLGGKMSEEDFILLAYCCCEEKGDPQYLLKRIQFRNNKMRKYQNLQSPKQQGPTLKQSFCKFVAYNQKPIHKLQSLGLQFGVDKILQDVKIEQLSEIFGRFPHRNYLLVKLKTNSNEYQICKRLQTLSKEMYLLMNNSDRARQLSKIEISVDQKDGYVYLVVEIYNPVFDDIISNAHQILQSVFKECQIKFKSHICSNIENIFQQDYDYHEIKGEIVAEFLIDNLTLYKIKKIIMEQFGKEKVQMPAALALLFQELKINLQVNNLGQALQFFIQMVPFSLQELKQQIMQKASEIRKIQGSQEFIKKLSENCQAQGEISLNLGNIYINVPFDFSIENAFDLILKSL